MEIMVNGKFVKVEKIGFVSTARPGENLGPGYMEDDVHAAADGRKFVERYIATSWCEYNEAEDGPIWTEELWQFMLKNMPKKTMSLNKPAVLRLVPGLNHDNPIVVVFDSAEDATLYWKADDVFRECAVHHEDGYNHLYLDGKIDVTWFAHVDVKYMNHEQLQDFVDKKYADWALGNNWIKLDDAAYRFVCGDNAADEQYCEWVEESLGIKHNDVFVDDVYPFEDV